MVRESSLVIETKTDGEWRRGDSKDRKFWGTVATGLCPLVHCDDGFTSMYMYHNLSKWTLCQLYLNKAVKDITITANHYAIHRELIRYYMSIISQFKNTAIPKIKVIRGHTNGVVLFSFSKREPRVLLFRIASL